MSYKRIIDHTTKVYRKKTFGEEFKEAIGVLGIIIFALLVISAF